jgi:predicted phage terminase large subunit-like protein
VHSTGDLLARLARLPPAQAAVLRRRWDVWGRPDQQAPPGAWRTWLILAGRGWGKSRTGAEWVRAQATSGRASRIALVARTAADVRDVIVEGESGILAISPPHERPIWEPSRRRLTWPGGTIATTYSAEEPDQLRGPQHDAAWCDELAAWRYPDAWDQLQMGLRLGSDPRVVVTTTPRPTPLVRALVASSTTVVTRGRTADNARNLAPGVVEALAARYAGTRLGRQELDGEILDDAPGALWRRAQIDAARHAGPAPALRRIVVGVDPAASATAQSDETGIVVAGLGHDGRVYVLDDRSGTYSPEQWAARVVAAYREHRADRVVAEVNQGGDMVASVLRAVDASLPLSTVHARRGKALRAEPVAALYEQGRVSHVGALARLEDQMCAWDPTGDDRSPDRIDALVYAVSDLLVAPKALDYGRAAQPARGILRPSW